MKSSKIIACILLVCMLFGGCMNQSNLKDLAIIEGLGIDKEKDEILLTVQSLNVGISTGTEKPEGNMTYNINDRGKTIIDAISNLTKSLSKELYFGHNNIILFGREICENDFRDKLDYFLRSSDSRADVIVALAEDKASDLLESKENDTHVPVENLVKLIQSGEKTGHSIMVTVEELFNANSDKTTDMYLPVLKTDEKSKTSQLAGIAIFNGERLSYILDDNESLGFMLINGKAKDCVIEFDNDKMGRIGAQLTAPRVKKSVEIIDGRVHMNVEICGNLMLNEIEKGISVSLNQKDLEDISRQAENRISRLCSNAFYTCQGHGSDSLRVGEYLAKDQPEAYEAMSDSWKEHFEKATVSVSVKIRLKKISDNIELD